MLVLRCETGEEIKKDDQVVFEGRQGRAELLRRTPMIPSRATTCSSMAAVSWVAMMFSVGFFVATDDTDELEDLAFLGRANQAAHP